MEASATDVATLGEMKGQQPILLREKEEGMTDLERVRINVWSDYVCPFCYLEEPILDRIAEEFGDLVEIRWRAFELRPEPVPTLDPRGDYLRIVWERAVYPMARSREMYLRLPPVQPRSRRAHEAACFAREMGKFNEMNQAIFKAFFEEGEDIGETAVLLDLAERIGLGSAELSEALGKGRYLQKVLEDERLAELLEVMSVPTIYISGAEEPIERGLVATGAVQYQTLKEAVEEKSRHPQARQERLAARV